MNDGLAPRPHLIGIDDAPFTKGQAQPVPLVAVMMEGADVVEAVATSAFPVDGDDATDHLIVWLGALRALASAQAIAIGGITIAGLGVIETPRLARALGKPVIVVTRKDPQASQVAGALESAGLADRIPLVDASPHAVRTEAGIYLAWAGCEETEARHLLGASCGKALLPEALRVAHLVARAIALGESRGRA